DDGVKAAIEAAGRLGGTDVQARLAGVVANDKRPAGLRVLATQTLVRHLQQYGVGLNGNQIAALETIFLKQETDPAVRPEVALLLGALRPDSRTTGERLKGYRPGDPVGAPPPPDKDKPPPDKDKPPPADKDKPPEK